MYESGSDRTNRERQVSIVSGIRPYLVVASPYSVWNPEKMDFRVSNWTRTLTNNEIENRFVRGTYPISDMFILRAIHYYGFSSTLAIKKLLDYWKQLEEKKNVDQQLCIPAISDIRSFWKRLESLCRNGVVVCNEFFINDQYKQILKNQKKADDIPWRVYSVTGVGSSMYHTALKDKKVPYDSRERFLSMDEIFQRAMCANLVASFLNSPYLSRVFFVNKYYINRKNITIQAVMEMQLGEAGKPCRLLMESITVRTNPLVISAEHQKSVIHDRIKELKNVLDVSRTEMPTYLLICAEDAAGIDMIRQQIGRVDWVMFQYCLVTTGTILEANQTIEQPQNLEKSFLEFKVSENRVSLQGATGYYFLDMKSVDGGEHGENIKD